MAGVHDEAARLTDEILGAIRQRQLEIARDEIENHTDMDFDSLEEVKRKLHLFYDLDEIPQEFRELEGVSDRLDEAYHALKGEDLAGDEQRFSTDIQPDEQATREFLDRLEDINPEDVAALDDAAIGDLEAALDSLLV